MNQTGLSRGCHHSGQGWQQVTPALPTLPEPPWPSPAALTLHDLLQLHLQGLHCPAGVVAGRALDAVDGQTPVHHGCHIIILQENHTVGVLDDSTEGTQRASHPALGSPSLSSHPKRSSWVEEFPRLLKSVKAVPGKCIPPCSWNWVFSTWPMEVDFLHPAHY